MNLKLNEWNEAFKYANEVCENLREKGYNTKPKPYSMYDGRMGIRLQVFDNYGNYFTQYSTGIHTDLSEMKSATNRMAEKITQEC